jgi:hypothetical protein
MNRKDKARYTVHNRLNSRTLTPQKCEVCGRKAQAHHEDYDDPLKIRWLCQTHHTEEHQRLKCKEKGIIPGLTLIPVKEKPRKVMVCMKISPLIWEALSAIAEELNVPRQAVIDNILENFLKNRKSQG